MPAITVNEEAEASLEGHPAGPLSVQSVQGGRGKKKPNPPSSKEAKKILITVSPSNKKGPQEIEINLRQALGGGQKAKVSPRQYQSCSAPD